MSTAERAAAIEAYRAAHGISDSGSSNSGSSNSESQRYTRGGSYLKTSLQDKKTNAQSSFQSYLAVKEKYGSSSRWYDAMVEEETREKTFVETLKEQIKTRENDRRQASYRGGGTAGNYAVDAGDYSETIEELQKKLEIAEERLMKAQNNVSLASEWRYYDADTAWVDSMKETGLDWGDISDTLRGTLSGTRDIYDETMQQIANANKINASYDKMMRQGGIPSEVGFERVSDDEIARLQRKADSAKALLDMTERRYGYSLDELAKDAKAVERGKLRAEHVYSMEDKAAEQAMNEYVENHIKGNTLGALRQSMKGDRSDFRPDEKWSDAQLNRYYVLMDRDEQAAADYAVEVNTYNNMTAQQTEIQGAYDWGYAADRNGWSKTARGLTGTAAAVASMPVQLGEYIDKIERVAATGAYTGNDKANLSDYAGAITQGRADSLNELGTIGGKGLGDVYQLTNSMAQSLVYGNLVGTAGTLALFFGSAANQGFDDAISRGATGEQASAYGFWSGVAEAAAELIPLENLLNMDKSLSRGLIKSTLIQAGLEGLEEGETDLMNMFADKLVMGNKSEIDRAIRERVEQGEDYSTASRRVWLDFAKNVAWDIAGGAISGGGSSVIQYGLNMASPYKANSEGFYRYGADAEQLGKEAAELKGEDNKELAALGKKVSNKAARGKNISNYTAQKLVKGTDRASIVDAATAQVKERIPKLSDNYARILANAIVGRSRGEKKLGPKGESLMKEYSEVSEAILAELDRGDSAQWTKEIGVRGEDYEAYGHREQRNLKEAFEEFKNVEKATKPEEMKATVNIGNAAGEVSGLRTRGNSAQLVVKDEDGKEQYVALDKAIDSGELPQTVAKLAYLSAGQGRYGADIYRLYEPGQNISEYVSAMENAILTISANVGSREAFNNAESVKMLTESQRDYAWEQGQKLRSNRQNSQSQNKGKKKSTAERGELSFEGAEIYGKKYKATRKDKIKANELRAIETIAKVANVNVTFYESETGGDGDYIGANGFYHKGTIYLDVHAGANKSTEQDAILLTAAHELTHHIRENAVKQYDALKEFVTEHLLNEGYDFETMVQSRLTEKGMSRADAVEEVIADACEMVLKDSKAVEKLAKQNRTLAQTIADWLHQFYEDIKAAFEGVGARHKEAQAMEKYMDELVKLWDDALIEASKGDGKSRKIKQSIRTDFYTEFDNWDGKSKKTFQVGETSDVLKSIGVKDKGVIWHSGKITEIMRKHPNMTKDIIKQVPQILENPVIILKSKGSESRLVIFGTVNDAKGKPITAILELESKDKQGHVLNLNVIASAYAKDNAKNLVESSDLVYLDPNKKRTKDWMQSVGLQLPSDAIAFGSVGKITYHGDKVKIDAIPYVQYMQNVPEMIDDGEVKFSKRDNASEIQSELQTLKEKRQEIENTAEYKEAKQALNFAETLSEEHYNLVWGQKKAANTSLSHNGEQSGYKATSNKNIAQDLTKSNGNVLQDKYPQLNLNEDISELDGIPAIELSDGSILPITNRQKYPTHVSFIEGNRIDIDDLKSGGWIGNGVYDPSFTSDTARYIERQQAKKRVSELTGKPYNQFRYSRRDSSDGLTKEEARAQAQAYTALKAENAALKRRLEYWKGQSKRSKRRTINRTDVDRYVRSLVKLHSSNVNVDEVKSRLYELGDYLVQSVELDYDTLRRMAFAVATDIIEEAEVTDDTDAYGDSKAIRRDIGGYRLRLKPMYKNDLPEGFRKQYRGKLHISFESGTSIDSAYAELQDSYGKNLFPDMPTQADMLVMMGDAYDKVTAPPATHNPYSSHMNEAITSVAYDIIDAMLGENIRQTAPTKADRAEQKLQQQKAEDKRKLNQLRAEKNARIEDIRREETLKRKQAVAQEKADKWKKVEAVRAYYQDMIQRQREARKENAATRKYLDRIYDRVTTLSNWLIKNSDKEHVPEALKEPLINLLNSIDLSSQRMLRKGEATQKDVKYSELMQQLRDVLAKQQAYMSKPGEIDGLDVYLDLPNGFDETIRQHIESVKAILGQETDAWTGGAAARMNTAQLRDLDFILTTLEHSIKQINLFITDSRYASVIESARDTMNYLKGLGADIERTLGREKAAQFMKWSNALPIYAFKRFGAAGTERFMELVKGWAKMAVNMEAAIKYAESSETGYTGEEAKQWEEAIHEIELSNEQEVRMSEAQIMGLYCSFKREQARGHLLAGGMRVGDIEPAGVNKKKITQPEAVQLTEDDIINITDLLSARQIEVADSLQKYMNTVCADWGNEISMARFGYRQFTEDNYYPIETDANNHPAVDPNARENDIFRLLNMSMTKALTPNANNSIVIFSIFDVFAAHTADMAKYNALALPILDLLKWYNYKDKVYHDVKDSKGRTNRQLRVESVQGDVEAAYGKMAQNYVMNFLKDLNGKREGGRNEEFFKGLAGNYKAAAVGANLRVAIQQPTSIVRASYVISPTYIARGAAMKGGIEEALEYSGLAKWKSMGYFDTNLARGMREQIKHTETVVDTIRDKSMWLAAQGDKITFGALWNAAKLEQQETKGLSGKELMQATTERFHEIILMTQVIDSTISRSDMMRNQSLFVSEITSFMSEPAVSYNMLMDSQIEYETALRQTKSKKEARKQTWPKMGKALTVFVISQAAVSAAAAIIDAMRDDDDYQNYVEKWLEHFGDNFKDNANPIKLIPFINDLWDMALNDETPTSFIWQAFTQGKNGVSAAIDMVKLWFDPEADAETAGRTNWGRLYQILQSLSSLTSIPVAGFMRDAKAVWNVSGGAITGKKLKFYDYSVKNSVKYGVMDGYIGEEEAITLLVDSGEFTDVNDAYWKVQEWLNADNSEWTRYDDVYAAVLANDKKAFEKAQEALGDHGIEPRSVRAEVKNFIRDNYLGTNGERKFAKGTAVSHLQNYAGLTPIEAQHLVDEWRFELEKGIKFSDLEQAFVDGVFDDATTERFLVNYGHEYSKDAAEKVQEWKCEKETGVKFDYLSDAYIHNEISGDQAIDYLEEYGGENRADAEMKVAQWSLAIDYGIIYSSTDADIKKALIEGRISDETAMAIMISSGGKSPEEAEDYVNQYHFTEETGYGFSEIEEAYADGVIDYDEMVDWFAKASINTHGSIETAREYADVAVWKAEVPGAEKMNRTGLAKWVSKGEYYLTRVGLGKEDFAYAWALYSAAEAQYDSLGNQTKEKAQVFFEQLYALYGSGVYTKDEVKAIARSIYSSSTINKYAPW